MEAAVPAPATLQRLAKAGGPLVVQLGAIEVPNYCLLKIT